MVPALVRKQPEQSHSRNKGEKSDLAKYLKRRLKELRMKQKELAITSGMPEARISRILHDGKVKLTEKDINQLAIGLQMSVEERNQLRYIAWPELAAIDKVLMSSEIKNITEANILLASEGLPLLGNDFLE